MTSALCRIPWIVVVAIIGLLLAAPTARADQWITYPPKEGTDNGSHIVFVATGWEYRSEEGMTMLAKILSQRHGFKCTVLFAINRENGTVDPNTRDNIPGLEQLASADMMVFFGMDLSPPDEQMRHIVDFVNSGKPIMGFRCSVLAFKGLEDRKSAYANYDLRHSSGNGGFGALVLGERWRGHHGHHKFESTRGAINGRHRGHPILKGVAGDIWGPTDVYQIDQLPDNAKVLAYGQVLKGMKPTDAPNYDKPIMPMIWTFERNVNGKPARVITSTIGAAQDLESEDLRRILVNGIYWGVGREDAIPEKSDVTYVDEFHATQFGLNEFRRDLRPQDFALQSRGE